MIAMETSVPRAVPPLAADAVTVAVAPEVPGMLAEIVVVPAPTAVASPEAFTVATAGVLEVQVTWLVTSWVLADLVPWPM